MYIVEPGQRSIISSTVITCTVLELDYDDKCSAGRAQVMVTREIHLVFKWRQKNKQHSTRPLASRLFNVHNAQIMCTVLQKQTFIWFINTDW